jgi:hypothetical protein
VVGRACIVTSAANLGLENTQAHWFLPHVDSFLHDRPPQGFTAILQVSGPLMPLYLWSFLLAVSLLLLTVYPTLIQPLFNKFTPLDEVSAVYSS